MNKNETITYFVVLIYHIIIMNFAIKKTIRYSLCSLVKTVDTFRNLNERSGTYGQRSSNFFTFYGV